MVDSPYQQINAALAEIEQQHRRHNDGILVVPLPWFHAAVQGLTPIHKVLGRRKVSTLACLNGKPRSIETWSFYDSAETLLMPIPMHHAS